jgi:predicted N-acyltransferase
VDGTRDWVTARRKQMNNRKSISELGLTIETLFEGDVAMEYWRQLGHQEFLMSIVHEAKEQAIATKTFLKIISEENKISQQSLEFYSKEKTVKEICELIEKHNERLFDILDIMWKYAKEMKEDQLNQ